ncbi:unnamed protein product [Acanthoscelides obtectus]|uniref:Uncharacterized protein n=1 Tax=Acanthoscelides obtectus TaxID=200917 RepID=A0A9P0KE26_ACAOB|nr:unnamed protein product [Acanthoscelides obtectus]CAK1676530.1 hypothetical protein AOBTE_LOCUS30803 [Acanthoscelides obtectus]
MFSRPTPSTDVAAPAEIRESAESDVATTVSTSSRSAFHGLLDIERNRQNRNNRTAVHVVRRVLWIIRGLLSPEEGIKTYSKKISYPDPQK